MDIKNKETLLKAKLSFCKQAVEIPLVGVSMLPLLREGDVLTVAACDDYFVGDILVFAYNGGDYIIHRLLCVSNGKYHLKGDNALRVETVSHEDILGRVVKVLRGGDVVEIPPVSDEFIADSFKVYRAFFKSGYDRDATLLSEPYQSFARKYLGEVAP